jgi:hypothetical protein
VFISGSPELWQIWIMGTMLAMVAMTVTLATPAAAQAERVRACLSPSETRESVVTYQLREPLSLLRDAARDTRADPLNSRLCRWNEQYVYEMSLLRRDGRVLRIFIDAKSGDRLPPRDSGQGR